MNREIKFRAWDEENKRILSAIDLSSPKRTWMWLGEFDLPLMQFTGLKDKNGKEIYEGDIIKETYARISGKIEHHTLFVRWNDYSAKWEQTNDIKGTGFGTFMSLTHRGEYEVIGNIYENKELLN